MGRFKVIFIASFILCGLFVISTLSYAAPVVVTSRAALAGNDFIDWGGFGSEYTIVANPSDINSNSGLITATVSMPSGTFERLSQGLGWSGNFASGDHLLYANGNNGPIVISFNNPVYGAGAQVQANFYGAFTATINVYDSSNTLIGSFNLVGNSTGAADNSAIFLGVQDTSATIKRIEYSVDTGDFSINQLDLKSSNSHPVPTMNESGMIIFMILGGLGAVHYLRRQKTATS